MQRLYTVNGDLVSANTADLGTHSVQAVGKVDNFRFARRVFNDRCSFGNGCCHHQVFRTGYGNRFHEDMRATQSFHFRLDVATLAVELCSHGLQTLDMQINRPGSNDTASWHGHFCLAKSCQQRTQNQN